MIKQSYLKKKSGQEDGSAGQSSSHTSQSSIPRTNVKSQVWWHGSVIPALLRREKSWRQNHLKAANPVCNREAKMRPCLKQGRNREQIPQNAHPLTPTLKHTHMVAQTCNPSSVEVKVGIS